MTTKSKGPGWEHWTTVSYSTVSFIGFGLIAAILVAMGILKPEWYRAAWALIAQQTDSGGATTEEAAYARFINLDGTVRVKKRDSAQFMVADYRTPLEEGDIVQTSADGLARITFVDGTTYDVKQDTLIVIEQNARAANESTHVAVQVTSGAVNLSTGSWDVPGSTSEVRFENAVARMRENTRAAVRQDPGARVHEVTVTEGQVELKKGREVVQVGPYERASFRGRTEPVTREGVMAPPKLLRPRNLEPIISAHPAQEAIKFEWAPVEKAKSYRFRLSTSPLFASKVVEQMVNTSTYVAKGLSPGEYYWTVRAVDAQNKETQESEPNRFTLAAQPAAEQLLLVIDDIIQHGRVVEVVGRTEPGATITINAEPVAFVERDGRFRHFTSPLPGPGAHSITVVAQNRRGEVVTRTKQVIVK